MLSIITAIHNQLPMNRLFYDCIKKYTSGPFELIIIDNCSTDGSGDFFEELGAKVIRNAKNYSYPFTQNQGIRIARGNIFAFLNNDIIVSPGWNKNLCDAMLEHKLDIVTCSGIENAGDPRSTILFRRKWNYVKNSLSWLGNSRKNLERMHRWMYGDWEKFCANRLRRFHTTATEGFVGNSVIMSAKGLEAIGLWDERIQAADFDMYVRSKKRFLEKGDVKPCHIIPAVFHHHYIRLTQRSVRIPFEDAANIIKFEEKYTADEIKFFLKDLQ